VALAALQRAIEQSQRPVIDPDTITSIVRAEIAAHASNNVVRVELTRPPQTQPTTELAHQRVPDILKELQARNNVMLVGPAGSGKTHAIHQCSDMLKLKFYGPNVGPQTSHAQIMGFCNATGGYTPGFLREPYEHGGVLLVDEIDAAAPGVLTCINQAISNGSCYFPDGEQVFRHPDFIIACGANTYGNGSDRVYVGRSQLDGATLDRFATIDFNYDEVLERALTPAGYEAWCELVQAMRKSVAELGIRFVVSPRATITGAKALNAGVSLDNVLCWHLFKGLSATDRERISTNEAVRINLEIVKNKYN